MRATNSNGSIHHFHRDGVLDYIKQLPLWKNLESATYILIYGASLLFSVTFIFSIYQIVISQPKYKHQEIQRFLQWAEKDMEEETPPKGMEPTC
jgi:hypothetical protein